MKTNFWRIVEQTKIEIPIIQRDYAQGRAEENRIARNFIGKIKSKLLLQEKLNLDFVYGKTENKELIPLDGQQRLTTLFLLHWYIATKEGQMTEEVKQTLSNFSYETRPSSQDFCKKLVLEGVSKIKNDQLLSKCIENEKWFSLSWKSDPTIKAILNMLNIIQEAFSDLEEPLFDKLISDDSLITFNYLPLDKFKLTDELYIKMNSRGKPLTEFENFKANFSSFLKETEKSKLDNEWYDIFWKLETGKDKLEIKNIDEQFYNFFSNITLNLYVEKKDIDKGFIDGYYLFNQYEEVYKDFDKSVEQIKSILDALQAYPDESGYFKDFIKSTSITYWERVRFYAVTKFFIKIGEINQANKPVYDNWIRVCRNLINNTLIQSPVEFYAAIRAINQLSEGLEDIHNYIITSDILSGLITAQQEEEKIKANLILTSEDWEKQIKTIENHHYFDGQIGFILNFSKENNDYILNSFTNYSILLNELFLEFKSSRTFLFQRALLTEGYYLIDISNSKTFCNFETGLRAKMDNWRKVFNDEKKSIVLKSMLDKLHYESLESDLNALIANYTENDWKGLFIKNKLILPHCCNFQIKKNGDKIYLSRSNAGNWKRKAELYTYDLFTTKLFGKSIYPFTRSDYYETIDEPCAFIDNWYYGDNSFAIDIFFNKGFVLSFFDRKENKIPAIIVDTLEQSQFVKEDNRYNLVTDLYHKEEVFEILISVCNKLESVL
ncbi:DUF262 domain-containing protein [Flavobacterium sedimenticola]|uniref:DUF262 domain-containing protein n=1 Tax=Flavobacterium sedimenticola TaxID=3043286 RepID=A0ABT6XT35_9FLAO|nr:DUF262 domain-containing protein [Flavobacterium sedimenticola]MDI9258183.1 DUF262 domain-containing protein [Flavobacterium sedimenticola]